MENRWNISQFYSSYTDIYRDGQKYLDETWNDFNCQKSLFLFCEANGFHSHGQWESHWIISLFYFIILKILLSNKTSSLWLVLDADA